MRKGVKKVKIYERTCLVCGKKFKACTTCAKYCGKKCRDAVYRETNAVSARNTRRKMKEMYGPSAADTRRQTMTNLARHDEALKATGYREPEVVMGERTDGFGRRWRIESRGRCMGGWTATHAPANK